jgi:hypothetical protein
MEMFDPQWMVKFQEVWNNTPEVYEPLQKAKFNSNIAYGLPDEDKARGLIVIENGKVVRAGAHDGEKLDWDLRATADNWKKWVDKPPGSMALGQAVITRRLRFFSGNFGQMMKNPLLAGPFIKHFGIMGRVGP